MMKPIVDKAEIALEYPDKFYVGTFERSSGFEAHLDETGIALTLYHRGTENERKSVHMHINYGLFADILRDLTQTVSAMPFEDETHREAIAEAARALSSALRVPSRPAQSNKAERANGKR